MITIFSYGIDPYSLRQLSLDVTPSLANLCEVKPEEINFYATEGLFVHEGVEQNTWYIMIKVVLPRKLQILQKEIGELLNNYFKKIAIHMDIIFDYYLSDESASFKNEEYPRYLSEDNLVEEDEEEIEGDEEIYTGDAFASIRDKLDK